MEFRFLEHTANVGVFENVSGGDNNHIYELISWAKSNNVHIKAEPSIKNENELDNEHEYSDNWWMLRNYDLSKYPALYQLTYEKIQAKIRKSFNHYLSLIGKESYPDTEPINLSTLHLMGEGDSLGRHFDQEEYGLVYYIGLSHDFSGGELHFIDLDLRLPPYQDRLVIIPSDVLHEVLPVTSGLRLSATAFVSLK